MQRRKELIWITGAEIPPDLSLSRRIQQFVHRFVKRRCIDVCLVGDRYNQKDKFEPCKWGSVVENRHNYPVISCLLEGVMGLSWCNHYRELTVLNSPPSPRRNYHISIFITNDPQLLSVINVEAMRKLTCRCQWAPWLSKFERVGHVLV